MRIAIQLVTTLLQKNRIEYLVNNTTLAQKPLKPPKAIMTCSICAVSTGCANYSESNETSIINDTNPRSTGQDHQMSTGMLKV